MTIHKFFSNSIYWGLLIGLVAIATFKINLPLRDVNNYAELLAFMSSNNGEWFYLDPGFSIGVKFSSVFSYNIAALFFYYAVISLGIKFFIIYYSDHKWLLITSYVLLFYLLHDLVQMRVGAASSFIILYIYFLLRKRFYASVCSLMIAFFFHYSSLACLPLLFFSNSFSRKSVDLMIVVSAFALFLNGVWLSRASSTLFSNVLIEFGLQRWSPYLREDQVMNYFNPITMLSVGLFLLSSALWFRRNSLYSSDSLIQIGFWNVGLRLTSIAMISYSLLANFPSVSFRLFEILSFPMWMHVILLYKQFRPKFVFVGIVLVVLAIRLIYLAIKVTN